MAARKRRKETTISGFGLIVEITPNTVREGTARNANGSPLVTPCCGERTTKLRPTNSQPARIAVRRSGTSSASSGKTAAGDTQRERTGMSTSVTASAKVRTPFAAHSCSSAGAADAAYPSRRKANTHTLYGVGSSDMVRLATTETEATSDAAYAGSRWRFASLGSLEESALTGFAP